MLQSGLVVYPDFPYLGASPDGIVKCDCCCSSGVLEIKGSFRCKSRSLIEASKEGNQFCLQLNENGCFELDMQHAYFYQVQAQMKLTGADYCDFVVWSPNEFIVLRISPDAEFIAQAIDKVTNFFKLGVLPELVGKWYSKAPYYRHTPEDSTSTRSPATDSEQWCYCQGPEEGEMIFCEMDGCLIEWFHTKCLQLTTIPKGKWICLDCRATVKAGNRGD